ncbi:MAG: YaaA family protein [Candidatus Saccharibacteria bacterium]|nr:MAG: YaaA family protein [Candidatus Saccharibacteria bacterium]
MYILIHSSKTMRPPGTGLAISERPALATKTHELAQYLKSLTPAQIAKTMKISNKLAIITHELAAGWTDDAARQRAAVDSFLGDIYSGLQVASWTNEDRRYANKTLRILSGLYGILRPLDGIYPYRLEMGYRLPGDRFKNLYDFWGSSVAETIPGDETIINLAAVEYSKPVTKYHDPQLVVTPEFLTVNPKTHEPGFVVVHTKIARGAFASWLIRNRITKPVDILKFDELNYRYDKKLSTPARPVFVCETFGGIGLSVRLS